ncbi:MAG TPA: sensor histidine kinase, partial [Puia sp.]|nr:sensor histidine kinase [Puia sp.]
DEILKTTHQLRELSAHLQSVREEERASVAREIHDELGQQLTGLKMDIASLNKRLSSTDNIIIEKVQSINQLLNTSIKTVRKIATELRPSILDDLGLIAAVEWQCQEFGKRSEIETHFFSDVEDLNLDAQISICLFRICQESLTNIGRYAQASVIEVSLKHFDDKIVLTIKDNGIGFDTEFIGQKKTWGLLGMKERAAIMKGKVTINSEKQKGTTVEVIIPISSTA